MDKKSVWKTLRTIKDPMVRAYLENAIEEQAEREKGCEYCNQPFQIEACHISEAGFKVGQTEIAEFCPKCGKRLK